MSSLTTKFCYIGYKVGRYALQNFVTSHNNRLLIDASLGQVSMIQVVTRYKVSCYRLQSFVTNLCYSPQN